MSTPNLDPELLRAFVAVADRLSFTRAAAALGRTQASVSLQVKRLEERLGVALLRRSTVRVELTAAGQGFLADARRILDLGDHALARLSGHRVKGRVRIGVMEDYGTRVLPALLAAARSQYPLVEGEMEVGLTARMLPRLGSAFDLVVAMHGEGATEGAFLRREAAAWAAAPGHASEVERPLPVALSEPGCLFRDWAIAALEAAGLPWRLASVSRSMAAVEAIVAQGLAVTVLKRGMLGPGLRVVEHGLPALPGAEIRLHRAPGLARPAALMADHLAQGLRDGASGR